MNWAAYKPASKKQANARVPAYMLCVVWRTAGGLLLPGE
jgi:hypothetical protein